MTDFFHEHYSFYNPDLGYIEVDESENLPNGIYASIIRYQPTHPVDVEDDLENEINDDLKDIDDDDDHDWSWDDEDMEF